MAQHDFGPNDSTTRQRQGLPRERLHLVFEKFQAFVEEYRPKISRGGMFLATEELKPVGTPVACEFRLADGFRLCQALGEVVWIRPRASGPDQPAGMGIRFQELDDRGRELVLRILEEQVRNGGSPFEVERVPPDALTAGPLAASKPPTREALSPAPAARPRVPAPRENPASTHAREAVQAASAAAQSEAEFAVSKISEEPLLPALEPVEHLGSLSGLTTGSTTEKPDFKAPWGQELPELPDEVIEPIDEAAALATAREDFSSDPVEAEFPPDLLEVMPSETELESIAPVTPEVGAPPVIASEAPDEISFADELDRPAALPEFETPISPDLNLGAAPEIPELELREESASAPGLLDGPGPSDVGGPLTSAAVEEEEVGLSDVELGPLAKLPEPRAPEPPAARHVTAADGGATKLGVPGLPDAESASAPADPIFPRLPEEVPTMDAKDEEWGEEDRESGRRPVLGNLRLSLAGARGRLLAVVLLLAVVGGFWTFRERILGWMGLGSPTARDLPVAQATPAAASNAEAQGTGAAPSSAVADTAGPEAGGGPEPSDDAAADAEPAEARGATEPEVISVEAEAPQLADPPPSPSPAVPVPSPVVPPAQDLGRQAPPGSGVRATGGGVSEPAGRVVRGIAYDQTAEGTRIILQLDGHLSEDRYERHALGYDPLKEQLVLKGIAEPFKSRIDVGTLELDRIRTGLHGNELKLVFDLSSELMTIGEIRSQGDRLVVLVRRR